MLAAGLLAAAAAGLLGAALEWRWFGATTESAAARGEAHVRASFAKMTRVVSAVAAGVASDPAAAAGLAPNADARLLFDLIERRVAAAGGAPDAVAVTIYGVDSVPDAWIGRPSDTYRDRINGPAAYFVTQSPLGLRLVHILPVVGPEGRPGAVAAEHVVGRWRVVVPAVPFRLQVGWRWDLERIAEGRDEHGAARVEQAVQHRVRAAGHLSERA